MKFAFYRKLIHDICVTKTLKAFWWNARPNWGDLLTPFLLEAFSNRKVTHTKAENAQIVVVGSVLEAIPPNWLGIVAGAGKMYEHTRPNLDSATILGLRGKLSAQGIPGDYVLGDPALLVDELVPIKPKLYNLGVVPHWSDTQLEHKFTKYNPKIIRSNRDPATVISEISQCKKIVSSSLHGIIVADAFRIPRRAELFPRAHLEGGEYKYQDYASTIGQRIQFGKLQEPFHWKIEEIQRELFDMFEILGKTLENDNEEIG